MSEAHPRVILKTEQHCDFQHNLTYVEGRGTAVAIAATCSVCGATEEIGISPSKTVSQEWANRLFIGKKWRLGAQRKKDVCPRCVEAERARRQKQPAPAPNVVPMKPREDLMTPVIAADPPREPTREERRIIFAKLEDVYLDETRGYSAGWSDARVAKDLDVPRAWVAAIRDENFGPNGADEETQRQVAETMAMLVDAKAVVERSRVEVAALAQKISDAEAKLSRLEKLYR